MVTRVAGAVGDAGSSATSTTHTVIIPSAAAANDVAILATGNINQAATVATPTGWTLLSGPDDSGTIARSYLLVKPLVAGEPGSTLTLTYSGNTRNMELMEVWRNATVAGLQFAYFAQAATTSGTLATIASVPAGAALTGLMFMRQSSTTAATLTTVPTGYTAGASGATAYASTPQLSVQSFYQTAASAGSYGGDSLPVSASANGFNYLVALPDATPAVVSPQSTFPMSAARRRASTW